MAANCFKIQEFWLGSRRNFGNNCLAGFAVSLSGWCQCESGAEGAILDS
jgi:hypothetical protein